MRYYVWRAKLWNCATGVELEKHIYIKWIHLHENGDEYCINEDDMDPTIIAIKRHIGDSSKDNQMYAIKKYLDQEYEGFDYTIKERVEF